MNPPHRYFRQVNKTHLRVSTALYNHITETYKTQCGRAEDTPLTLSDQEEIWNEWCWKNLQGDIDILEELILQEQ